MNNYELKEEKVNNQLMNKEVVQYQINKMIEEKGFENLFYVISKTNKKDNKTTNIIDFKKEALKQITIDFGLREEYSDLTTTVMVDDAITSVKLTLRDNNDRFITTSYGSFQKSETRQEWLKDFGIRGTQVAQGRALKNAIMPFIIKLGLSYKDLEKDYEISVDTKDVAKIIAIPKRLSPISNVKAKGLYAECLNNDLVFKTTRDILKAQGVVQDIKDINDLTLYHCARITVEQFNLIKQAIKGNK